MRKLHCCSEWKSICFWFTDQGIDTTDDQDEEEEEEEETEESCRVCKHICCCCCCPLLKMIVRFMLVLVPSLSSVILLTLYFTVPSFNNVFSERLSFASFFAYSITIGYLGVLCIVFYVTLHWSIPYIRHQHVQWWIIASSNYTNFLCSKHYYAKLFFVRILVLWCRSTDQ